MTVRHAALAAGAVLVLGVGVYLFFEVRAAPAAAPVQPVARAPAPPAPPGDDPGDGDGDADRGAAARGRGRGERESGMRTLARGEVVRRDRARDPEAGAAPAEGPDQPHKTDALMSEANKAYDRGDMDDAKAIAQRVLARAPDNVRMLRVVVSASCITGDNAEAQKAYLLLPPSDREQMRTRCARYGVTFTES